MADLPPLEDKFVNGVDERSQALGQCSIFTGRAELNLSLLCCCTEEFEAHSSSVSCLALAKSSGRLLATGGEDCRVNIWAVSKANCIMVRPELHLSYSLTSEKMELLWTVIQQSDHL